MQPHITKTYDFLDQFLPIQYTEETQKILKKKSITVSDDVIRNVRTQKTITNLPVLNALLKVAKAAKKESEVLEEQLTK